MNYTAKISLNNRTWKVKAEADSVHAFKEKILTNIEKSLDIKDVTINFEFKNSPQTIKSTDFKGLAIRQILAKVTFDEIVSDNENEVVDYLKNIFKMK